MLVITRREDESFMVGDEVEVFLLEIRGTQARIGINAPKEVAVHRKEVWVRIQEQGGTDGNR